VVVASGLVYVARHPDLFTAWESQLRPEVGSYESDAGSFLGGVLLIALLSFPPMALGLSGFELSAATAPMVAGDPRDDPAHPRGRIRNTRKLLVVAAVIMSLYVLGAVFVVTLLLPPGTQGEGNRGMYRALAYLAHGETLLDGRPASAANPLFGT